MIKLLIATLSVLLSTNVFALTQTTHYSLYKPNDGSTSWGSNIRDNFDIIDTQMFVSSSDITNHMNDLVGAHAATAISSTVGSVACTSATDVQSFLDCLDLALGSIAGGNVVNTTTDQTVGGIKTWSSNAIFLGDINLSGGLTTALASGVLHSVSGVTTSSNVVNADVDAAADIARTKLASGTADHVLINSAAGVMTSEAQLDRTRGGTGVSSTATFPSSGIVALVPSSGVVHSDASVLSSSAVLLASEVSGTLPVGNGGTGLTAVGTANQVLGVNAGASANEYKTIAGTSNQVTVTHGVGTVTLSTPQDIDTSSSPTFATVLHKTSSQIEDPGAGTNKITIQAPTLAGDYTLTMPVDDGTSGQQLQTDGSGVLTWQTPATEKDGSLELTNVALSVSMSGNAATIALKTKSGGDPGASDVVKIGFRNSTLATGTYVQRSVTGALSTVISSGSTGGTASAVPQVISVYAIDNAGTVELAWSNGRIFNEGVLYTTTQEGGAGNADSINTLYSTTQRTNVAVRYIGSFISTQATAGTWATSASNVSASYGSRDVTPRSMVRLHTSNGYGAVNNKIRRFTTAVDNYGTAITYADSANDGALFTINEDGLYSISYSDTYSGAANSGLSINSAQLTTSITTITAANRLMMCGTSGANTGTPCPWSGYLRAGDLVRPHADGTTSGATAAQTTFTIVKVSD